MSRIALTYGATIDKYVGDAIVIFFGDPDTRGVKEDALACVKMAIAMRENLLVTFCFATWPLPQDAKSIYGSVNRGLAPIHGSVCVSGRCIKAHECRLRVSRRSRS